MMDVMWWCWGSDDGRGVVVMGFPSPYLSLAISFPLLKFQFF